MAKPKFGFIGSKQKKAVGLIYHLYYDLNFSYSEVVNVLNELGIMTISGAEFSKMGVRNITVDKEYWSTNFIEEETLEKVRYLNKIKEKGLNLDEIKEKFNIV